MRSASTRASIVLAVVLVASVPLAMAQGKSSSKTPHCYDVQVEKPKEVKDEHKIAGTAIGAVAGGLLGNQIGGGSGKKIATVAGAAGGAYAGRKVQENNQNKTETVTERRCD